MVARMGKNGEYTVYDVKNLYGITEMNATLKALNSVIKKRGAVVSRLF